MTKIAYLLLSLYLPGCSIITYEHKLADGQTYKIYGAALGTTRSIEDFKLTAGSDNAKSVSIGKYGEDQTQAIAAAVEGAIKGVGLAMGKP